MIWWWLLACEDLKVEPLPGPPEPTGPGAIAGVIRTDRKREVETRTPDEPACGGQVELVRADVVGDRLVGAVVWVDGVPQEGDPPAVDGALTVEGCRFVRPVAVATRTGSVLLTNNDTCRHRLVGHWRSGGLAFEADLLVYGLNSRATFSQSGVIDVSCLDHEWEQAAIRVVDLPWATVTGDWGAFDFSTIPPGDYLFKLWHPVLGSDDREIRVLPGRVTTVEFSL